MQSQGRIILELVLQLFSVDMTFIINQVLSKSMLLFYQVFVLFGYPPEPESPLSGTIVWTSIFGLFRI